MEPRQLEQLVTELKQTVTWLDEERRKDKALITKLEERATSQNAIIQDQVRRIQSLEGDLSGIKSTSLTASTFDEAFSRIRTEFGTVVENVTARRDNVEQEMKKLRDMDRDALMKALDELRQEMGSRLERELQLRRAEEDRLSRASAELQTYANNLTKGHETIERTLAFLEEQRRQESRRISDMTGELVEFNKRSEGQKSKLELLEELSRRTERGVEQVNAELSDFKHQRQVWSEQEALTAQQREQMMSEMLRRMDSFAEEMTSYGKQVAQWGETHREMKKHLDDFNRLADRVDRRLGEVAEMQRLSEDRFRQGWEEFQQEEQKQWRQFTLTNEETRRAHEKAVSELQTTVTKLSEQAQAMADNFKKLRGTQQDTLRGLSDLAQTLREQNDDGVNPLPVIS